MIFKHIILLPPAVYLINAQRCIDDSQCQFYRSVCDKRVRNGVCKIPAQGECDPDRRGESECVTGTSCVDMDIFGAYCLPPFTSQPPPVNGPPTEPPVAIPEPTTNSSLYFETIVTQDQNQESHTAIARVEVTGPAHQLVDGRKAEANIQPIDCSEPSGSLQCTG